MKDEKKLINKEALIRRTYANDKIQNYNIKNNKMTLDLVRTMYEELENQVIKALSEVTVENNKDNPIIIKLFDGISLSSYYKPPIDKVPSFFKNNPDMCELENFKSRVGIKTNITRYLKERVAKLNKEYLEK